MDDDLKEALETLHDFRVFWHNMVTQTKLGAGHENPMWRRVVNILDKHGMNDGLGAPKLFYVPDPAYIPSVLGPRNG